MILDPSAPMRSLREAAGLSQADMAAARGVARPSQHQAEAQGDHVQIATLLSAAEAAGLEVEIRARKKK